MGPASSNATGLRAIAISTTLYLCAAVQASWSVHVMHPYNDPVLVNSAIYGVTDTGSVGFHSNLGGESSNGIQWTSIGSPPSFNTLLGIGSETHAQAACTDGFTMGGGRWELPSPGAPGPIKATVWYGSATNVISLHPLGASSSYVRGLWGGRLVGFAVYGNKHAAYWEYPGNRYIDLHANRLRGQQFAFSEARAIQNDVIGGTIGANPSNRMAAIWSGRRLRLSIVHPAGYTYSQINGVYADAYVGLANNGSADHAYVWSSLGGGFDIHPAGSSSSFATAIDEDMVTVVADGYRAMIFDRYDSFTPYEDLDAILDAAFPATYIGSQALCLWRNASTNVTMVGGFGLLPSGEGRAILWVYTP